MSVSIIPKTQSAGTFESPGILASTLRPVIVRRLEALRDGQVTLIDSEGVNMLGQCRNVGDPRAEVVVLAPAFYRRVAFSGHLGAAESYLRGEWTCDNLTDLFRVFTRNLDIFRGMERGPARLLTPAVRAWHALRHNSVTGSRKNIHAHYDLGNDFFRLFLDDTMAYSCGIFKSPESSLREASIEKMDRICRKLQLSERDHLLEIGTGWGGFAIHAAGNYGCRVTTTTISREQHDYAARQIRKAGLEGRIELCRKDYRELEGRYDKLVSIEMIEAVGHRYLPEYLQKCSDLLKPDGAACIQAITMADYRYEVYRRSVDFIQRYVFPGSCLPSLTSIHNALAEGTDLKLVQLEDITPHYAETLRRWRTNFFARLEEVKSLGYPDEFIRLWEYYLCYCEAGFEERFIGDVQLVLAKPRCHLETNVEATAPNGAVSLARGIQ